MDKENAIKGGAFMVQQAKPEEVFIPEEFDEEQQMIAQTCQDFLDTEVFPVLDRIDDQEEGLMPELLTKSGELGLLGISLGVSAALPYGLVAGLALGLALTLCLVAAVIGGLLAVMVLFALPHPVGMAVQPLTGATLGLDGLQWMDAGDRAIVGFLREQPAGTVIVEAVGGAYSEYGRIGIKGASYGGYVALAALVDYPEVFGAGIDHIGIANSLDFLQTMCCGKIVE